MEPASIEISDQRQSNLEKQREILLRKRRQKQAHEVLSLQARTINASLDASPVSPRCNIRTPHSERIINRTEISKHDSPQAAELDNPDLINPQVQFLRISPENADAAYVLGKVVTGAPAKNTYQAIHIPPVRPVKLPLSLLTAHRELNNVAMLAPLQERTDYFELSGSGDDDNGGIPQSKCSQSGTRLVTKRLHSDVIETSGWPKGSEMTADFGDIDSKAASSIARRTTSIPFNCRDKSNNPTSSELKHGHGLMETNSGPKPPKKRPAKGKTVTSCKKGRQQQCRQPSNGAQKPRPARSLQVTGGNLIPTTTQTPNTETDSPSNKDIIATATVDKVITTQQNTTSRNFASPKLYPIIIQKELSTSKKINVENCLDVTADADDKSESICENSSRSVNTFQNHPHHSNTTKTVTFAPTVPSPRKRYLKAEVEPESIADLKHMSEKLEKEEFGQEPPENIRSIMEKPCKQVPSEPVQGERTTVEAEDDVEAFITTAPPNEPNILGLKGPRKMAVLLPQEIKTLSSGDLNYPFLEPTSKSLSEAWKINRNAPGIQELHNKKPVWNEVTQSYVLNFHGRVTQASVKNFQLVNQTNETNVILQFGRTSRHTFSMDFKAPLTALQAFGIALSSLTGKLACE